MNPSDSSGVGQIWQVPVNSLGTHLVHKEDADRLGLSVSGGEGNDTITTTARVNGLELNGGAGNDRLIGGAGGEKLVGGSGSDDINGGEGSDYIAGGSGDDTLDGGDGHDTIQGGAGTDTLVGGLGSDSLYVDADDTAEACTEGADSDLIVAEDGANVVTDEKDVVATYDSAAVEAAAAWLGENVELEGDEDFRERVTADIAAMMATEAGRALLGDLKDLLQKNDHSLRFREKAEFGVPRAGGSYFGDILETGSGASVHGDGALRHPLPTLFHELVHTWQHESRKWPSGETKYLNGVLLRNSEAQATGLPWIDANGTFHDPTNDPDFPHSENVFRIEIGLAPRQGYVSKVDEPVLHVGGSD